MLLCDDERDKTVFHNTTSDLQTKIKTGLVLRPTVSDPITIAVTIARTG